MLEIRNLTASFDSRLLLRGVDLKVNPGETHIIYGPNGSGKSTLGKVLLGHPAYTKENGSIRFERKDLDGLSPWERAKLGIFLSHQTPPEIPGVAAEDILLAAKKSFADPSVKRSPLSLLNEKKEIRGALAEMRLPPEFLRRGMNEGASGGERKKLECVSLFTIGAKLAFLDEIDSGLDFDALKLVVAGIRNFLSQKGKSVVLVTHSERIIHLMDSPIIHVFCDGKIISSGGREIGEKVTRHGFDVFRACEDCIERSLCAVHDIKKK